MAHLDVQVQQEPTKQSDLQFWTKQHQASKYGS